MGEPINPLRTQNRGQGRACLALMRHGEARAGRLQTEVEGVAGE